MEILRKLEKRFKVIEKKVAELVEEAQPKFDAKLGHIKASNTIFHSSLM